MTMAMELVVVKLQLALLPQEEDPREPSMKAALDVIVLATPPNAA